MISVHIDDLREAARNPNRMEPERFDRLVESIRHNGFVQPILVTPADETGGREIVDGHHRVRAAAMVGISDLPAVEYSGEEDVELARLAMGNRGRTDLTVAGAILADAADAGRTAADLTWTGYSPAEIDDLLEASRVSDDDLEDLTGSTAPPPDAGDEGGDGGGEAERTHPYELLVTFPVEAKKAYQLARRRMRRAAGKGGDNWRGLMRLIGEDA